MATPSSQFNGGISMTKKQTVASGEERLIERHFRPLAKHPGAFNLVDDAAALAPPAGCDLVLTVDGIVGGVHFFPDDPSDAIAKKALRVNLSDLAAKGARPLGFLLTLALPKEIGERWLASFARGLGEDADTYDCPLLGGDTVRTPGPVTISIAAFGAVPHGKMARRGDRHDRRCRAWAPAAARRRDRQTMGPRSAGAGSARGPLSAAAAAYRHCRSDRCVCE